MPQQGMPLGTTSPAHSPASFMKDSSIPIFLLLQGTWMATLSRTWGGGGQRESKQVGRDQGQQRAGSKEQQAEGKHNNEKQIPVGDTW
jgi:hypothetical protein